MVSCLLDSSHMQCKNLDKILLSVEIVDTIMLCWFWMCSAWYLWLQAHMIHSSCECPNLSTTWLYSVYAYCESRPGLISRDLLLCTVYSIPFCKHWYVPDSCWIHTRSQALETCNAATNRESVMYWSPVKHWACSFNPVHNTKICGRLASRDPQSWQSIEYPVIYTVCPSSL